MEKLFENETRYTKEALRSMQIYFLLRVQKIYLVVLIGAVCLLLLFVIRSASPSLSAVGLAVYFAIMALIPIVKISRYAKTQRYILNKLNHYECYQNELVYSSENSNGKLPYRDLYCVRTSKQYIYLFVSGNQAFILDKSRFTLGDEKAFLAFLRTKTKVK